MKTVCDSCIDEQCFICVSPRDDDTCCCQGTYGRISMFNELAVQPDSTNDLSRGPGRPKMDGADMKNALQAGRARAEDIAPITEGMICEWVMLKYAGGGVEPIVGCEGNLATDRHHGPDKSTLNNNPGVNLHRICVHCHNRWHYRNDMYYKDRPEDNSEYLPYQEFSQHDRLTQASAHEVLASNSWWSEPVKGRAPFRAWEKQDDAA